MTPTRSTIANEKPGATDKPTATMSTTSPKAHGQIGIYDILPGNIVLIVRLTCNHLQEFEPVSTNPSSTPHKEDVRNTPQRASASGVHSTATSPQDNSHILIDEAITDAIENASTSATNSQKKSKSTKSKGVVASGRGRKRDHDTMTNATRPANEFGGSAIQASRSDPTRDGSNTFSLNKFQPILPKATGPAQPGTVGHGQGNQVLDSPGQSQHDQSISGGHAASGFTQRLEEVARKVPSLSEQDLAWLPAQLRDMASKARETVTTSMMLDDHLRMLASQSRETMQASMILDDQWNEIVSYSPTGRELGVTNKCALFDKWITLRQRLIEVATAAREGRQPTWPCVDQPQSNSQSMNGPPNVPANVQQVQYDCPAPTISGTSLLLAEPGQIGKMSEDIDLVMRISSRNESVRQTQNAQLHSLLINQTQAQAQGFQELQSAHRRADEARDEESDTILKLIKTRSELLNKKDD